MQLNRKQTSIEKQMMIKAPPCSPAASGQDDMSASGPTICSVCPLFDII